MSVRPSTALYVSLRPLSLFYLVHSFFLLAIPLYIYSFTSIYSSFRSHSLCSLGYLFLYIYPFLCYASSPSYTYPSICISVRRSTAVYASLRSLFFVVCFSNHFYIRLLLFLPISSPIYLSVCLCVR